MAQGHQRRPHSICSDDTRRTGGGALAALRCRQLVPTSSGGSQYEQLDAITLPSEIELYPFLEHLGDLINDLEIDCDRERQQP